MTNEEKAAFLTVVLGVEQGRRAEKQAIYAVNAPWEPVEAGHEWNCSVYRYRLTEEPATRPYRSDEVPPLLVVHRKDSPKCWRVITAVDHEYDTVFVGGGWVTMQRLHDEFARHEDGGVCGVEL